MSRFVEEAISRAGLAAVLAARRLGDVEAVRLAAPSWESADFLVLGALADLLRGEDVGNVVRVHEREPRLKETSVHWVAMLAETSDLDFLRAVATARVAARTGARIGVDWSACGMELAQVALGFGASELRGPIQRKSGLVILDGEKLKLKGQGLVELRTVKKQEIRALITHAGRVAEFVEANESVESVRERITESKEEVAGV